MLLTKGSRSWLFRLMFTTVLLALLVNRIEYAGLSKAFEQLRWTWSLPTLALYSLIRFIWAYQMSFGVSHLGIHATTHRLFEIILIASFYSLVLPGSVLAAGRYVLTIEGVSPADTGGATYTLIQQIPFQARPAD